MEAVTKRSKKFRGEEPQQGILVRSRVTKMEGLVASPFFICINGTIGALLLLHFLLQRNSSMPILF